MPCCIQGSEILSYLYVFFRSGHWSLIVIGQESNNSGCTQ